jgi:hypothetical protein
MAEKKILRFRAGKLFFFRNRKRPRRLWGPLMINVSRGFFPEVKLPGVKRNILLKQGPQFLMKGATNSLSYTLLMFM